MSWMRSVLGSFNLYTMSDILAIIGYGPKNFGASFLDSCVVAILLCVSNTLSPTLKLDCS